MRLRRIAALTSVGLTAALLAPAGGTAAGAEPPTGDPYVVRFAPGIDGAEQVDELAERGLEVVDRLPGSDHVLVQPVDGADLSRGGAVREVAPLVTYRAFGAPDDPAYRAQWHLQAIDAAAAWDVTTGAGAVVAVLDTGVAYETIAGYLQAPDLAGTRFTAGWDFVDNDARPNDESGHGTHVVGAIAQTTNNGRGGAGAAPGVTIMPLRVLDGNGVGNDWNVAQALRFAADRGADVANMSLGSNTASTVVSDAIAYAQSKGVTIVAASGNDGIGTVSFPARLDSVIGVGAVRLDRTRAGYSNHGAGLDLVAPGGDLALDQDRDGNRDGILQETFLDGITTFCMCFMQGTSMAAPQVSAVAALVASRGVQDPKVIRDVLVASAADLGPAGRDDQFGHGLVQAGAAVRAPLPGTTAPASAPPPAPAPAPAPAPTLAVAPEPALVAPVLDVRSITTACPAATTPPAPFADVAGSVHADGVGCAVRWQVASGRTPTTFDPGGSMDRAQLASFVARLLEASGRVLPATPPDAFSDDAGSVHELRINQLAALGVVRGRGTGTYDPGAVVTRAEMATFLVRAHDVVAATPLAGGPNRFSDDDGNVHEASIDKVAGAGLAAGTGPGTFAPAAPVGRGQMATFLSRTIDLFVATGITPLR